MNVSFVGNLICVNYIGHILKSAKRVFGIPDFKYYTLEDGLQNIFSRFPGQLQKQTQIRQSQLSFGFTYNIGDVQRQLPDFPQFLEPVFFQ